MGPTFTPHISKIATPPRKTKKTFNDLISQIINSLVKSLSNLFMNKLKGSIDCIKTRIL